MSKKKSSVILSLIILIASTCGITKAKSLYAGESDSWVVYRNIGGTSAEEIYMELGGSGASITVYTDRSAWESAVNYDFEEEFFTDTTLNPGVSVITDNGYIDNVNRWWWDQVIPVEQPGGPTTTTWIFADAIIGYGGNWDPAGPGGPGTNIQLYLDGTPVSPEIPNSFAGNFFGVVSTVPFNQVLVSAGTYPYGWCERYTLDNMVYAIPSTSAVNLTKVDDVNDGNCVGPGDEITYTIDYNYPAGPSLPDIHDVNLIDYLPEEVEFISASGNWVQPDSNTVIWNMGTLEPNESGFVTLTVKVKPCVQPCSTIRNRCKLRSSGQVLKSAGENTPVCCPSGSTALMPTRGFYGGRLKIIDINSGTVTYEVNFAPSEQPMADVDVVVTPDGSTALMPTRGFYGGRLKIIDINSGTVTYEVNFAPSEQPMAGVDVVVTPDGSTALMPTSDFGGGHLKIIDINSGTVTYEVNFAPSEQPMADVDVVVTPDGSTALMPTRDFGGGHLKIIDIGSGTVTRQINFGPSEQPLKGVDVTLTSNPYIVLMPTGDFGGGHLKIIDIRSGTVRQINFGPSEQPLEGVDVAACSSEGPSYPVSLDEDFVHTAGAGNYLVVDDFERYISSLADTWKAAGNATVSLSMDTVYEGAQAMAIDYNNTAVPYYCEAYADANGPNCLEINDVNWLKEGVKALSLWFYGTADNDANEQMYMKLTDGTHTKSVMYDGDMNDVREEQWHEWNIDLAAFTGVTLTNVTRITIGFGDGIEPGYSWGSSTVYFDDIRLYATSCVLSKRSDAFAKVDFAPGGEPAGDCVVDNQELVMMAETWLEGDYTVDGNETIYHPFSPAELYEEEPEGQRVVNFKDFAVLADKWLTEEMFPR
jgi:hypothetical protein